ncbi:thermonuclease family protein [Tessaracoccus lubricantis]|uniref:Thermonuclease family protein n=1 Tax=Tessaracoccus lubricantis TaxID=545543 RepID=A0ABP9EZ91_9ACTN
MIAGPALLCLLLSGCFPAPGPLTADPTPAIEGAASTTAAPSATPTPTAAPTPSESPTEGPAAAAVGGLVRVAGIIDGDTIDVRIDGVRTRVRVIGIDTPERDDCGYQEAASAMQSLVQSRDVRLESDPTQGDTDRYDRLLRHVFTADGVNVAEEIISRGLGREYTYAAPYKYVDDHLAAQADAQQQGLGLWGSMCGGAQPEDTQAAVAPLAPVAPVAPGGAGDCVIKGNINREGERIYHVPGQEYYDRTKIDVVDGEQWFCTPEEAEAAGWRPAKR